MAAGSEGENMESLIFSMYADDMFFFSKAAATCKGRSKNHHSGFVCVSVLRLEQAFP